MAATAPAFTKAEIKARIKGVPADRVGSVVCALVGHSRVVSYCFGYLNCMRCDAQVGDALGSTFDGRQHVYMDHGCDKCRENEKALTFEDVFKLPAKARSYLLSLRVGAKAEGR